MNIVVCDDNQKISDDIIKRLKPKFDRSNFYTFIGPTPKLFSIADISGELNIFIVDIELGEDSGFDVAKKIKEINVENKIIMLTGHYDMIFKAIKNHLDLYNFVVKTLNYIEELEGDILEIKTSQESLIINHDYHQVEVFFNAIIYISFDSSQRKTIIHLKDKCYTTIESLSSIESKLSRNFIKIHRAYIINKSFIVSFNSKKNLLYLKNNEILSYVSKVNKKKLIHYVN